MSKNRETRRALLVDKGADTPATQGNKRARKNGSPPLETPLREEMKTMRRKQKDKNVAAALELLHKGQMVGLRALEEKMMGKLMSMKRDMLGDVANDLTQVVVEKVTPFVEQMVADAVSGANDEGNSPVVQAVIDKIIPQVTNIFKAEVTAVTANQNPVGGQTDQSGAGRVGGPAAEPKGKKGFFKNMQVVEKNKKQMYNLCDR